MSYTETFPESQEIGHVLGSLLQNYVQETTIAKRNELDELIEQLKAKLEEVTLERQHNESRNQEQLGFLGKFSTVIQQTLSVVQEVVTKGETNMLAPFWNEMEAIKSGNYTAETRLLLKEVKVQTNSGEPYTEESLKPMKTAEVKEIARAMGISDREVKEIGSRS